MTGSADTAPMRYYEQSALYSPGRNESAAERVRLDSTLAGIPEGIESAVEVGCGNGALANRLRSRCRVVGVDLSQAALAWVQVPRVAASVDVLPFRDRAFDLLLAAEMLEHLPESVFARAREEVTRVARRYILVTVPNDEDLRGAQVQCAWCGCAYHPYRHVRSFRVDSMSGLFPGFRLREVRPIGPRTKRVHRFEVSSRRLVLGRPRAGIRTGVCPQCGEEPSPFSAVTEVGDRTGKALARWKGALSTVRDVVWPQPAKEAWILALYERVPVNGKGCVVS